MRITASDIQLSSAHLFEVRQSTTERLRVRLDSGPAEAQGHHHHRHDRFDAAKAEAHDIDKLVKLLQRYLSGKLDDQDPAKVAAKIDALVQKIEAAEAAKTNGSDTPVSSGTESAVPGQDASVRFDLRYFRKTSYQETEATSFRASGSVATADGRQIDFTQALDLARAYARTETISLRATGVANVGALGAGPSTTPPAAAPAAAAPAPEAPATQQALSLAGSVLGFDANGDGQIDLKSELVGQSGNGFTDLAALDSDGNGFVDEGDAAFGKLALVDRTADGLAATTLSGKGVGAIYTGSVATPYTFTGPDNQATAQLARSGIYLNEDGTTGIAQQVNVLV